MSITVTNKSGTFSVNQKSRKALVELLKQKEGERVRNVGIVKCFTKNELRSSDLPTLAYKRFKNYWTTNGMNLAMSIGDEGLGVLLLDDAIVFVRLSRLKKLKEYAQKFINELKTDKITY